MTSVGGYRQLPTSIPADEALLVETFGFSEHLSIRAAFAGETLASPRTPSKGLGIRDDMHLLDEETNYWIGLTALRLVVRTGLNGTQTLEVPSGSVAAVRVEPSRCSPNMRKITLATPEGELRLHGRAKPLRTLCAEMERQWGVSPEIVKSSSAGDLMRAVPIIVGYLVGSLLFMSAFAGSDTESPVIAVVGAAVIVGTEFLRRILFSQR